MLWCWRSPGRDRHGHDPEAVATAKEETVTAPVTITVTQDAYPSNTALYQDPNLVETVDYARRWRRRELFDGGLPDHFAVARTTIIAPHGGGIEFGTSELCLAVAGYHPATLQVIPGIGRIDDYWMFEGVRATGNSQLHVTASHCDDGVAVSMCAGALNALALHGCTTARAGLPDGAQAVLVGGRNATLKQHLLLEFAAAGLTAIDALDNDDLNGDDPANIANRTLLGMGGHLELTGPLRQAMFDVNTRLERGRTTTAVFWAFAAACRNALGRLEATQIIL
jgi:phage replication-related protein YjqB (UPF0714/DUF867 family)